MAKILFAPGIEEVSGALSKIKTKSLHVYDQNMFLATHRKAETCSRKCQRAYMRKVNSLPWQQTTSLSTDTMMQRDNFATASREIAARRQSLEHASADRQALLAIKNEVTSKGYTITMRSFLWVAKKLMGENFSTGAISMTALQYINNTRAGRDDL